MSYHRSSGRVAPAAAHTARPCTIPPERRARIRRLADDCDARMRDALYELGTSLPKLPEPRMLFSDVAPHRHRPYSVHRAAQMIAAAREDGAPIDRALMVAFAFVGWVRKLYADERASTLECFIAEQREQAEADAAQSTAVVRTNLSTVETAIRETREHLVAAERFLARLEQERDSLLARGRMTLHATPSAVASAANTRTPPQVAPRDGVETLGCGGPQRPHRTTESSLGGVAGQTRPAVRSGCADLQDTETERLAGEPRKPARQAGHIVETART